MDYRQNHPLKKAQNTPESKQTPQQQQVDLVTYFKHPLSPRQKQYEAVRAVVLDQRIVKDVAQQFGYTPATLYSLLRDAKAGRVELFPCVRKGPHRKHTSPEVQDKIVAYRRQRLSCPEIQARLNADEGVSISAKTVERCLKDAGFGRLQRRTRQELGKTVHNTLIAPASAPLNLAQLAPFDVDCPSVGVFFFLPYILEAGLVDIVQQCNLPESSRIGATQASLSLLLLKLIGKERLSHIKHYEQEPGLGIFAGLTRLPSPTYMGTYSCGCSETQVMDLQRQVIQTLKQRYADLYRSEYINLDFHSIPHYGDESAMEQVGCGARGKAMKGANTVLAQDSQSNVILYTRADILRREEAEEVKKFVTYWRKLHGKSETGEIEETLVFDCKFTTYPVLGELDGQGVKFITLRKRCASLLQHTASLPKEAWSQVYLPIPKRKYKRLWVNEQQVHLKKCPRRFRQLTIKGHGRLHPTFVLTNNDQLPIKHVLDVYVKRWHVENKLAELVAFFNLNALSSPLMIRIHFDMVWTVIADTLYHRFAQDLRRFEKHQAPQIFRNFIDMPGRVVYDGNRFMIKIRTRAHTPILREVEKLQTSFRIPWLENTPMEIIWTP